MTLYLLPNLLGPVADPSLIFPPSIAPTIDLLTGLIAESEKGGRRFLALFGEKAKKLPLLLLNEHTRPKEVEELLLHLQKGEKWGLISDAGLPSLGDPGSTLVYLAQRHHIQVEAFSGPSSITLALLLSGFNGNRFFFHGYLPIDREERKRALVHLENLALKEKATQIFIETPYRNVEMLKECLNSLNENTLLAIAWNLTLPNQGVFVGPLREWQGKDFPLKKNPAVFLISSLN